MKKKKSQRSPPPPPKNNMRTLRFNRGEMTQAELARRVGLTRQTIGAIEQGRYSPSLDAAIKIAKALKTPIDEVFELD